MDGQWIGPRSPDSPRLGRDPGPRVDARDAAIASMRESIISLQSTVDVLTTVRDTLEAQRDMLVQHLATRTAERDDAHRRANLLAAEMKERVDTAINMHLRAAGNAQRRLSAIPSPHPEVGRAMVQASQLQAMRQIFGVAAVIGDQVIYDEQADGPI